MAINTEKSQQQAAELSSQLWAIADDLRGGMDANEFRNYILGTIFLSIKIFSNFISLWHI